jgi:hypothetical protein
MLAAFQVVDGQNPSPERSKAPVQPTLKLKSVELDNKYTIQVPESFAPRELNGRGIRGSVFVFGTNTTIQVVVLPYSYVIPIDEKTGLFKLPIGVNNSPLLTRSFKIHENQYVYYGWKFEEFRETQSYCAT